MFEYEVINKKTNDTAFLCGHNWQDALRKHSKFNPDEWEVVRWDYTEYDACND